MRIAILSLAALVAAAAPVRGVVVVPATFEELVRESVAVLHGRVTQVDGRWTSDRRTIESVVTLEVTDTWKGGETSTATFLVPGGEAGGRLLVIPGAPVFRAGDEVVVFLRGRAPALPQLVGLSLGVYRVAASRDGGRLVIPTPVSAAAVPGPVTRGTASRAVRPLAAFAADVRAVEAAR